MVARDRAWSRVVVRGVAVLGGFQGNETLLSQRPPLPTTLADARDPAKATVLSGDLAVNDNGDISRGDNSYHVVSASGSDATASLSGVTITKGHANGASAGGKHVGGGVYAQNGGATITSCWVVDNRAHAGGGLYVSNGRAQIQDSTFTLNRTTNFGAAGTMAGAGAMLDVNGEARFDRSRLWDNIAGSEGGAIAAFGGSVPLLNEQRFVRVRYGLEDGGVSVDTAPLQLAYDPSTGQSQGLLGTPAAASIGEFDGVNGPDLAVAIPGPTPGEPGAVLIFLNQGVTSGQWNNFAAGQQIVVLPVGADPSDLAVANMDGQQRDDLVVATRGDSRVRVLLNNGTGLGFATGASIATSVPPSSVAVAPLLDDPGADLPDIMVAEESASRLVLLRTNDLSTPSYTAALTLPVPRKPRGVRPTGEDRDKRQNVVVMMADDDDEGSVQIIRFQPNHTLSVSGQVPIGRGPRHLATGDLNDDGLPEVVTANAGDGGTVSIVVNRTPVGPGTPELAPAVNLPIVIGAAAPAVSVAIADIQGDGVRDVAVVAGGATRSVYAMRNDTPAGESSVTLAQAQSVPTSPNPLIVVATDVDQSGVADLIGISGSSGGGRSLDQIVTLPARPLGCTDLDFNNDGVFPDNQDIADLIGVFAGGECPSGAGLCDSIDFNADGVFPDTEDLVDFINVFAGGTC